MHNLNPAELTTLPAGWHADGGGLFLAVTETGTRSWAVKYSVSGQGGQRKTMGLGGLKDFSLKSARKQAEKIRRIASEGLDPKRALNTEAQEDKIIPTFGAFADERLPSFIKGHKSQKTVEKWNRNLGVDATPIRGLRIDKITSADMLAMLEPHYMRAPAMARELRGRIEKVFSAAIALGIRPRELGNPATRRDNLEYLLPKIAARGKQRGPQPSMPYDQVPGLILTLRAAPGIVAKALLLVILTALRTNEARELQWSEIDLDEAVIKLEARRMKNGLHALVPLSPPAVELLRGLQREAISNYVFPGRASGKPISTDAMLKYLQTGKPNRPDCTVHGFRSSFRSWGDDVAVGHSRAALEFCLHHIEGGEAERAYKQGAMVEKRRAALTDWANYILPSKPTLRIVA